MKKIIMSREEINAVCKKIGKSLSNDLKGETMIPVFVGIMKGSTNFLMDLVKCVEVNCYIDFIHVSSYSGTKTTGKVILKQDLSIEIKDRTIVLVEDVIDTGISMNYLLEFIKRRHQPKRIILVSLFDKKYRRKQDVKIDYVGKVLESDDFLYGYGLDYNELGRNLDQVYGLNSEEIHALDATIKDEH